MSHKCKVGIPMVIADAISRAEKSDVRSCSAYNDGSGYPDGYGDAGYGDYGDSVEDPDPTAG